MPNFRERRLAEVQFRRITLLRTPVNKGMKKGRSAWPRPSYKGQFAASASLPRDAYYGAVLKRQVVADNGLPMRSFAAVVILTR